MPPHVSCINLHFVEPLHFLPLHCFAWHLLARLVRYLAYLTAAAHTDQDSTCPEVSSCRILLDPPQPQDDLCQLKCRLPKKTSAQGMSKVRSEVAHPITSQRKHKPASVPTIAYVALDCVLTLELLRREEGGRRRSLACSGKDNLQSQMSPRRRERQCETCETETKLQERVRRVRETEVSATRPNFKQKDPCGLGVYSSQPRLLSIA